MRLKITDIPYCSVDSEKIKNTSPELDPESLKALSLWIVERYQIHIKKDVMGLPPPWTRYEPMKTNRFTNVRREHDRESKWLIKNISENVNLSLEEKILNSILFRTWNKSETMMRFGGPFKKTELLDDSLVDRWRSLVESFDEQAHKYTWYTNAFNCGGLKAAWGFPAFDLYECTASDAQVRIKLEDKSETLINLKKAKHFLREHPLAEVVEILNYEKPRIDYPSFEPCVPARMFWLIRHVIDIDLPTKILSCADQKSVFDTLQEVRGFSGFLAYQVFVDLTYISEFPFSENEFTVAGPGCQRGIDLLFTDRKGLSYEEAIFWLRDNQQIIWETVGIDPFNLFSDLPEEDRKLNVMSLENCFCEHSKHTRILNGGKARVGYHIPKGGFF